jgi:hypothetical protein
VYTKRKGKNKASALRDSNTWHPEYKVGAPSTAAFSGILFLSVSRHSNLRREQCTKENYIAYIVMYGPGSSVGIATDYGLEGPEIESR